MALNGTDLLSGIQATGLDKVPDALSAIDPSIWDVVANTAGGIGEFLGNITPTSYLGIALAGSLYAAKRGFSKEGSVYPGQKQMDNSVISALGGGVRAGIMGVAGLATGYVPASIGLGYWNLKVGADKKRMQKNAEFNELSEGRIATGIRPVTEWVRNAVSYIGINYGENIDARDYLDPIQPAEVGTQAETNKAGIKKFLNVARIAQREKADDNPITQKLGDNIPGFVPHMIGSGRDLIEQCFRNVTKNYEKNKKNGAILYTRRQILEAMVEFGNNMHVYGSVEDLIPIHGTPSTAASALRMLQPENSEILADLMSDQELKDALWESVKNKNATLYPVTNIVTPAVAAVPAIAPTAGSPAVPPSAGSPAVPARNVSRARPVADRISDIFTEVNSLRLSLSALSYPPTITTNPQRIVFDNEKSSILSQLNSIPRTGIRAIHKKIDDIINNASHCVISGAPMHSSLRNELSLFKGRVDSIPQSHQVSIPAVAAIPASPGTPAIAPHPGAAAVAAIPEVTETIDWDDLKNSFDANPIGFLNFHTPPSGVLRRDLSIENFILSSRGNIRGKINTYLSKNPIIDNTSFATSSGQNGRYKNLNTQIQNKFYKEVSNNGKIINEEISEEREDRVKDMVIQEGLGVIMEKVIDKIGKIDIWKMLKKK